MSTPDNSQALIKAINDTKLFSHPYATFRAVEIGVRNGDNARALLEAFPRLQLFLVDPYEPYQDINDFYTDAMQHEIELRARQNLKEFAGRVLWIKTDSKQASECLWATRFDFCFIDGVHTLQGAWSDIMSWKNLVRPKGIIAGHDYDMEGVRQAVNKFFKPQNITHVPYPADVWYTIQKD